MRPLLPLALVKDKGSGVVVSRHSNHNVPVNSTPAALVNSVPCNG